MNRSIPLAERGYCEATESYTTLISKGSRWHNSVFISAFFSRRANN